MGRHIANWNDERLKSDMALSTSLSINQINSVAKEIGKKLSRLFQPISLRDIATTTHYTLVEMGYKNEGEKYMEFLKERRNSRHVRLTKVNYISCKYCGATNQLENEKCSSCGAILDRKIVGSKIV